MGKLVGKNSSHLVRGGQERHVEREPHDVLVGPDLRDVRRRDPQVVHPDVVLVEVELLGVENLGKDFIFITLRGSNVFNRNYSPGLRPR